MVFYFIGWSQWTSCSCDKVIERTRHRIVTETGKKCYTHLSEKQECRGRIPCFFWLAQYCNKETGKCDCHPGYRKTYLNGRSLCLYRLIVIKRSSASPLHLVINQSGVPSTVLKKRLRSNLFWTKS